MTPYHPGCGHIGSKNTLATVHKLERINQTAHIFFLKALCGSHGDPRKCPALWGAFFHMPTRSSGECGVKNGTWCLQGKDSAGSPGNDYYAVCAIDGELPYFDSISFKLIFFRCTSQSLNFWIQRGPHTAIFSQSFPPGKGTL